MAIRFSTLHPDGTETNIRYMDQEHILKTCPHFIMWPDHYREDGSCKCNDPNEKVMKEWGYRWSPKHKQWR